MSDLQIRRDARRRKILENAEKRLQKITGVEKRNADHSLEGFKSPTTPEEKSESPPETESYNGITYEPRIVQNHTIITNTHINSIPELRTLFENVRLGSQNNIETTSPSQTVSNQESPFAAVNRNILITIIAFLTNILLIIFKNHDPFLVNKIFVPLLCFEAVDFFYTLKNTSQNDGLTNLMLIFFRNIPPHILVTVGRYFRLFTVVFRDMMVYFFVFVCFDYLLQFIAWYLLS